MKKLLALLMAATLLLSMGATASAKWVRPVQTVETWDEEADFVIVGFGLAGAAAAAEAHAIDPEAKVVVLEKAGAIAAAREAIRALNSKLAPDHQEDVPTLLNHANQTQAGDANMLMSQTWAEKSGELHEWMADKLGPKGNLFPLDWPCPDAQPPH